MTAENREMEMGQDQEQFHMLDDKTVEMLGEAIFGIYERFFMNMPEFIFDHMFATLMSAYAWQHGWKTEELFRHMDDMKEMLSAVPNFSEFMHQEDEKEEG